jgi:hypothetical protein
MPFFQPSQSNPPRGYAPAGIPSLGGYNIAPAPPHVPLPQSPLVSEEGLEDNAYVEQGNLNGNSSVPFSEEQWSPSYSDPLLSFGHTQGQGVGHDSTSYGYPTPHDPSPQHVHPTVGHHDHATFTPGPYQGQPNVTASTIATGTPSPSLPTSHDTLLGNVYQRGVPDNLNQFEPGEFYGTYVQTPDMRSGARYSDFDLAPDNVQQEIPM